jgi:hypothetical protein
MNLIIDIGNTRVKIAVFDQKNDIIDQKANNNDLIIDDIKGFLSKYNIKYAIVSQVGNTVAGLKELLTNHKVLLKNLDANLKLPFSIAYKTPQSIGSDRLALVAPESSIAIIRAYSVAEKLNVNLGEEVRNVVRCTFSNCITQNSREPLPHRLKVTKTDPLTLRCHYCQRPQDLDELIHNLL